MGGIGVQRQQRKGQNAGQHQDLAAQDTARQLLIRAGTGDSDAFRQFYETTFNDLSRYVASRVPASDVDDVVADTYLRAFRSVDRYREGSQPALAWLITIARNRAATHLKRSSRQLRPSADQRGVPSVEELSIQSEEHSEVLSQFQGLPEHHQRILKMRFIDDLPVPVCAVELNTSEGAVRAMTFRALSALRRSHPDLRADSQPK